MSQPPKRQRSRSPDLAAEAAEEEAQAARPIARRRSPAPDRRPNLDERLRLMGRGTRVMWEDPPVVGPPMRNPPPLAPPEPDDVRAARMDRVDRMFEALRAERRERERARSLQGQRVAWDDEPAAPPPQPIMPPPQPVPHIPGPRPPVNMAPPAPSAMQIYPGHQHGPGAYFDAFHLGHRPRPYLPGSRPTPPTPPPQYDDFM